MAETFHTGALSAVIGEGMRTNRYEPIVPVNPVDDPDEFCPICNSYHYACFTLPGVGGTIHEHEQ